MRKKPAAMAGKSITTGHIGPVDTLGALDRDRLLEQVVQANSEFLHQRALDYSPGGHDEDDLMQVASIGLLHALKSFDVHSGKTFYRYCDECVRNELVHFTR